MSLAIAGAGWVTPLGAGVPAVWERLVKGEEATAEFLTDENGANPYPVFRVPASALQNLPVHPRLRRAGAISRFAAAAGLGALKDANLPVNEQTAPRIAVIFAIANGGVVYTKRFYHDIVATGAETASPLLFPETVFNAPASHLAAILGIAGSCYTLVGDGAVGAQAIAMAEDLMASDEFDHCLVVGAEETDWLLCDAYAKWRLLRVQPPIEPFRKPAKGTILSEGAGAIVISRSGKVKIERAHRGVFFSNRRKLGGALRQVLRELEAPPAVNLISSANGTFIDQAEALAIAEVLPQAQVYTPKPALGESVGAGGLWQTIIAMESLRSGQLPPVLHGSAGPSARTTPVAAANSDRSAVVLNCGLNQQVAGLRLSA